MAEVLVVCRANLCRSPAVELLMRDALGPGGGLVVRSAGLRVVEDRPVPVEVSDWLSSRGLDVAAHRPRGLRRADVDAAALVVVMTRAQRSALVTTFPTALRRTVLLAEAADRVVLDAGGALQVRPSPSGGAPDLVDPYGRPAEEVAAILEEAASSVVRLAEVLREGHAASPLGVD